jgi:dTDP-4-dehydrorhamnose reductase
LKVLVTGAGGLVGRAVAKHCAGLADEVLIYTHQALDILNQTRLQTIVEKYQPEAIINCAAWTDVDGCELDRPRAFQVNAEGPENLAWASRKVGAAFVTISTDYVFDGRKSGFYSQRDDPNPESVYAISKLAGERKAQAAYARTVVARTGFVFGPGGKNFLSTVVERGRQGERLQVIADARGTPTYAPDLAKRLRELAELDLPGIYHVVNSGNGASFDDFTRLALRAAGNDTARIEPVSMASLNRPAPRPQNSCLKCLLSEKIGLTPLRRWEDALGEFVAVENH